MNNHYNFPPRYPSSWPACPPNPSPHLCLEESQVLMIQLPGCSDDTIAWMLSKTKFYHRLSVFVTSSTLNCRRHITMIPSTCCFSPSFSISITKTATNNQHFHQQSNSSVIIAVPALQPDGHGWIHSPGGAKSSKSSTLPTSRSSSSMPSSSSSQRSQ